MTITEFLEARLSEDEAVARAASAMMTGPSWEDDGTSVSSGEDTFWVDGLYVRSPEDVSAHIARHDPARVLAECAAKRRVLETLRSYEPDTEWGVVRDMGMRGNNAAGAVRALAAVYASHPDYQQEWAV
jgi:hypothetical protein